MSGFTDKRASDMSEPSDAQERVLTWEEGRAMLPLVGKIAGDIAQTHQTLTRMRLELRTLERRRRELQWPERRRRYQLEEEIVVTESHLRALYAEVEGLGVVVLDPSVGLVGFPTLVNDRRAFFSWQPGEGDLDYWNFADELIRRPVPADWTVPADRAGKRSRSKRK